MRMGKFRPPKQPQNRLGHQCGWNSRLRTTIQRPPFLWEGKLGPHLTQCRLGRGLPPCQVPSWSIQPFGHNRHGPKICGGSAPLGRGELGPHLTQCGQGRGLPACQVSSWSIQPFGHNRHRAENWGSPFPFWGGGAWSPSSTSFGWGKGWNVTSAGWQGGR